MKIDFSLIAQTAFFQRPAFAVACDILLYAAAVLAFGAILVNFLRQPPAQRVVVKRKSIVETASMTGFFGIFLSLCLAGIGRLGLAAPANYVAAIVGLAAVYGGLAVNLAARLQLGGNWANQVQINQGQYLVAAGLYAWVRHPLYASTILMLYGLSLFFQNPLVLAFNTLAFIPFMLLRVRQEEAVLQAQFPAYADYRRRVGCFFPRRGPLQRNEPKDEVDRDAGDPDRRKL